MENPVVYGFQGTKISYRPVIYETQTKLLLWDSRARRFILLRYTCENGGSNSLYLNGP